MTREKLADSPWLWLLVFSIMALAALVSIQGKYAKRQAGIEFRAEVRSAVVAQAAGESPPAVAKEPPSTSLWVVAAILSAIALFAAWRLWRSAVAMRAADSNSDAVKEATQVLPNQQDAK